MNIYCVLWPSVRQGKAPLFRTVTETWSWSGYLSLKRATHLAPFIPEYVLLHLRGKLQCSI